jgi:acetoacetate decarboxylase
MNIADILKLPSMPLASPSYPRGWYRFVNREYLIVTYESDPQGRLDGSCKAAPGAPRECPCG